MMAYFANVGIHVRCVHFLLARSFSTSLQVFQPLLDHPLIWNVDWFKVKAGFFAIVDPTSPRDILYLSGRDYQDMIKVSISNREPLVVLARAGDDQPSAKDITASKPNLPHSPVFFRSFRVYSRFLRNVWDTLWKGKLIVPTKGNFSAIFCSWSKILLLWLGTSGSRRGQSDGMRRVSEHLLSVMQNHGVLGLALYLKVSLIILNRYLSGDPLVSSWDLKFAVRISNGLPKWFPVPVRMAIRSRSLKTIRLMSSLLYMYKGIYAEVSPLYRFDAVASVRRVGLPIDQKVDIALSELSLFLKHHWLPHYGLSNVPIPVADPSPPLLTSGGPSGLTGIAGVLRDLYAWSLEENSNLRYSLQIVYGLTGNQTALKMFNFTDLASYRPRQYLPITGKNSPTRGVPCLGRIGLIPEAAGKVRAIAMFDYFSQWAFQPIHDFLLHILSGIEQDGTSSQDEALRRFRDWISTLGRPGKFISIDISAATDTIPWQLYAIFLESIFNGFFAKHYMSVLRDRQFLIPKDLWPNFGFKFTDYWRGQPMGAWSSFPLLGVIHHILLGWSAFKVGLFPFREYSIVGDDLVIFDYCDERISSEYLNTCRFFGIPISKTKTYRSDVFFNFISRSFLGEDEITPVSLRHELSIHSMAARVEGALRNYIRWDLGTRTSPPKDLVPRLARYLSDPWSWKRDIVSIHGGYLTPYLSLLLSAIFAPFGKSITSLGVADTGWLYWLASTRGSTFVLSKEISSIAHRYLGEFPDVTRTLVRTAVLALRSELESSMESHSKTFDRYIEWLKAQSAAIRLVYPLIRADREDYACWNLSRREVLPLLGYPPEDSESLLDQDLNYEELGISHEDLMESYIMELLIHNWGFYVPRVFLPHLRVFHSAWKHIQSDTTPVEDLGIYLRAAWDAVAAFKPLMDYSNVGILQKVSRDDFGSATKSSIEARFQYARPGVTDRLVSLVSLAWKLTLANLSSPSSEPRPLLPLPKG
jgi:hypothetical protein